jgi:hypothetical protein
VVGEILGHHHRLRSVCLQVQPGGYMLLTSSGFPLLNWGNIFFYKFL